MEFSLDGTGKVLANTPHVLRVLLAGLPEQLLNASYGPKTWSPHEVVGHLIHCEMTDWMPRDRLILQSGESVAFEPFVRDGHSALCVEKTTGELLDIIEELRKGSLAELRSMSLNPAGGSRSNSWMKSS